MMVGANSFRYRSVDVIDPTKHIVTLAGVRATRLAAVFFALAAALFSFASCEKGSGFAIGLDSIRSTGEPIKPVALSLWIYPEDGEKEMSKLFTSEKITDSNWIALDGDFVSISSDLLSPDNFFAFRIELNPNRFATPPDAIFRASVPLADLFYDTDGISEPLVVRAQQKHYEIRIVIKDQTSEN